MNGKTFGRVCMAAALLAAVSGIAGFGLAACASEATTAETSAAVTGAPQKATAPAYWTGNGGKDLSIAVLVPEGKGLSKGPDKDETYLPSMVQGVVVGDFTKFSAMKVLDRQNLDKVIAEGESGYYENESNFAQLGASADVRYLLTGSLQKTGSGFMLQLGVVEAANGESRAAYSGNCTAAQLDNLSAIKTASADLLAQLGVTLTDAGKTGLLGATASNVAAETALAKGITAQRSGTVVEAMSYYYEAAKFDPGLAEAASRNSVLTAEITSGNIGQNVRNDIQRRAAWVKTLDEAAAFFKEHPPYEIIYDPALTQGRIDYAKETADISFRTIIIGTTGLKIIDDLGQGLNKTGKSSEWRIGVDSIWEAIPGVYNITATLLDENGEAIGSATGRLNINKNVDFSDGRTTITFANVDANKITDKLTVSINGVNGINAKAAGERGYISISVEDFAALKNQFEVIWHFGGIAITGYTETSKSDVIPAKIGRWPVTSIGDRVFYDKQLTSVTIPNSVTSIGQQAFDENHFTITSVTMPANVELRAFAIPCQGAYEANGKKAGTYKRPNVNTNQWTYQP
jgi:TolB-like protein